MSETHTVNLDTKNHVPHPSELFIGGEWVEPAGTGMADVISPTDGSRICSLPLPSIEDARLAVEAAARAFDGWNQLALSERREHIARLCKALESRSADMERVWALETGIAVQTGAAFTGAAQASWTDTLAFTESMSLNEVRETPLGKVEVRHEGVGPTVAILTYNGPLVEMGMVVIPSLLAGNPCIVKLPPENRMLGYLFADAAAEAKLPSGLLSILAGEADVSRYLVAHQDVAAVHFTGGTAIGAEIMKVCADRMAHVTLELGGKSAAIIAPDANLEDVVPVLAGGLTMMSGQMCIAMSRILVARPLHDELVERLVSFFAEVKIGDPLDPETVWGPLASQRARERAEGFISRAVDEGAQIACGGTRPPEFPEGHFLTPTVLTNVKNDMEVAQEEVFGPVFSVIPFDSIDEAVELANASKYGLAGSIFTQDEALALDVARRVRSGAFSINATFPCLTAPFGGMKQSGFGREGGMEGLLELTNIKSIALPVN